MISLGLLWFDDDNRRSAASKVAEAVARFEERTGYRATTVHVHPALASSLAPASGRAGTKRAKMEHHVPVRVVGDDYLGRHYYLVGIEAGETPRPVRATRTAREARKAEAPRAPSTSSDAPEPVNTRRQPRSRGTRKAAQEPHGRASRAHQPKSA